MLSSAPMAQPEQCRSLALIAFLVLAVVWLDVPRAAAQDLPAVSYTIADGLPADEVIRIVSDPAGLLWLGTSNALVRFDGHTFKSYGRTEGLDVGTGANDIRVGNGGHLWISTNGNGIFRFDLKAPDPGDRFRHLIVGEGRASNRVNSFALTAEGAIWAATDAGLFVGSQQAGQFMRVDLMVPPGYAQDSVQVTGFAPRAADLWVSTAVGIYRCQPHPARSCARVLAKGALGLIIDHQNRLWTAGEDGLSAWRLQDSGQLEGPTTFGGGSILRISLMVDGSILAGTRDGRALIIADGRMQNLFDTTTRTPVMDVLEDSARNIWLATRRGLFGVRRQGVSIYASHHGLREPYLRGLFRDRPGRLYALSEGHYLHRVGENRLDSVRLMLPPGVGRSVWLGATLVDSREDVWLGTARGLFRYSKVEFSPDRTRDYYPSAGYTTADGLAGDHIAAIFEDRHGNLWVSSVPTGPEALAVRGPGATRFERLGVAEGMPAFNQPADFVEDHEGAVWATLREGGVVRIRGRRALTFGTEHGFPRVVDSTLVDRRGHLWFGAPSGLVRVQNAAADAVRADAVAARTFGRTHALEQDATGAVYVGTDQGLSVVDEQTGRTLHYYSSFDGFPPGTVELLARGADNTLLVTVGRSLVRLDPGQRKPSSEALRCILSTVRVGGVPLPLPESGIEQLDGVEVQPGRNHLEVEFLGLSPHIGEPLAFEYRLGDVSGEWQRTSDRRVAYTGLASGRYRFEVRATGNEAGSVSVPSTLNFRVLPPWYLRTWFLALLGAAVAAMVYGAHRVRLRQAVAAEQLRSRIATDLHDDLGASLSQIAVFSEVLRRRRDAMTAAETDGVLEKIGTTSRQLVSSMSDIVWAVNPRQDSLGDLVARMRWFAEDMFGQSDTEFELTAPAAVDHVRIGPLAKRETLLILKESVTNIVKHAHCRRAGVELGLHGRTLTVRVWDDGRGFDPEAAHQGNGIRSLRARGARLQGRIAIRSSPGSGTEVMLTIDLQ